MPAKENRLKLTSRVVEGLPAPQSGDVKVWDSAVRGFGVRVYANGRRVYIHQFRPFGGRGTVQRTLVLGTHGDGITAEEARQVALLQKADGRRGVDAGAERRERRAASRAALEAPTVEEAGELWLASIAEHAKPRTIEEYRRLWRLHVLPALGRKRVADVAESDVRTLHRSLRAKSVTANRVLTRLHTFFGWAESSQGGKLRPRHSNPTLDVVPYKEQARERYLTSDEMRSLGDALSLAETIGLPPAPKRQKKPATGPTAKHRPKNAGTPLPANPYAVAVIRFLLLSGFRESEALSLQWSAIDLESGRATLADTKTGRSNRQLGRPAVTFLSTLSREAGSDFVFPGRKPGTHLVEIGRVWDAVRHAAGILDVRLHDLRHSLASVSVGQGASLHIVGKLLGHKSTVATTRYAHLADDPQRAAMDAAQQIIAPALGLPVPEMRPALRIVRDA